MKYELTNNMRFVPGFYAMVRVYQIRALRDIPMHGVNAGDLGGWVSEKAYLEQNGKWFLHENAEVFGGYIDGGEIRGGYIHGGRIKGDLLSDFGQVPCLIGGRYPVNFAGYSETGERKFACGCQVYEESKWTPELMKTLARQNGFTEQERIQAEKMFEFVKKMTPKKTSNVPEKTLNRDPKTGRFLKKN